MKTTRKTYRLAMMALMAAVLAIFSPLSIPVGPVPLTLGVFAVYLTAAMLPPLPAMGALAVYISLGAVGLPVFSNYRGGPQVLVGPTGGYIMGYFIIVFVVAGVCAHTDKLVLRVGASVVALILFYLMGTLWYMLVAQTSFFAALTVCVVPFIIPDLIKAGLALVLATAPEPQIGESILKNIEIERKWLMAGYPELPYKKEVIQIQGYLAFNPSTVRIRKTMQAGHTEYFLTIKGEGMLTRTEVELPLAAAQYEALASLVVVPMAQKRLRLYPLPGGLELECSHVDEAEGCAFYYAEVEFEDEAQARQFVAPQWLGREVTHEPGYSMGAHCRAKQENVEE